VDLKPGSIVVEKFQIIDKIGAGGMGAVYTAKHLTLNKTVVLKILLPSADMAKALIRFQNEAKILGRFKHPGIADIYDVGMADGGGAFIALEYVDGIPMDKFIERKEQLPISQLLQIFIDIADALQHAHREGVIHRDIKPGNIMLIKTEDADYSPVLLDFGIAKHDTADSAEQNLTGVGVALGSPLYMSPEQCLNQNITAATDQYSLGCVLFECLAGEPPFVGENALETMQMHMLVDTPDITDRAYTDVPEELREIIDQMLEKDPAKRFSTMEQLIEDLTLAQRAALAMEEEDAKPPETQPEFYNIKRFLTPKWLSIYAAGAVLTGLIFVAGVSYDSTLDKTEIKHSFETQDAERSHIINTQLQELDASKIPTATDKSLAEFDGVTGLRRLDLSNNEISDTALRYFTKSNLRTLLMQSTTVKTLELVPQFKNLTWLSVDKTEVDDAAVKKLTSLKNLELLGLRNTKVTEHCFPDIAKIKSLECIGLDNTRISDAAIDKLQKQMPALVVISQRPESLLSSKLNEANALKAAYQHDKAAKVYLTCADTIFSAQGSDAPVAAKYLADASFCFASIGKRTESLECAQKALSVATASENGEALCAALRAMAHYSSLESDFGAARKYREQELDVIDAHNNRLSGAGIECLFTIASLHIAKGEYAESKKFYKECSRLRKLIMKDEEVRGKPERIAAINYGLIRDKHGTGVAHLHLGEFEQARKLLLDAHDSYATPKNIQEADVYGDVCMQVATCLQRQNHEKESLRYAREGYETGKKFNGHRWRDYGKEYARVLELTGDAAEAARIRKEASAPQ